MRLTSLTSLRFFAAAGVFLHHFEFYGDTKSPFLILLKKILFEGFVGVTFFYVLSGFIIAYSYEQHRLKGTYRTRDFLFNRFSRLYPVHFLTLLIAILAYIPFQYFNIINPSQLLANIFLFQSAYPDSQYYFNFNGVAWSVSTEMFFYVAFVFLVTLNTKQLSIIGASVLALIIAHIVKTSQSTAFTGWLFYINPAFRIIDFIVGMLLCRLFLSGKITIKGASATSLEFMSLLVLLGFVTYGYSNVSMLWRYDIYYITPMAFIVFVFSYGNGMVSRFLSKKTLLLFGDASFSLYMIHQILIHIAFKFFPVNIDSGKSVLLFMLAVMIIGIALSCVLYKLYENPINTWLRKHRAG
ncbi:acyltransferase family protein [Sodalis sp. C49]|uniref:acyltransferase family protein n=1 Tax=Sodalis sp. C49 TaxID=3228929 RepID=UPI003965D629